MVKESEVLVASGATTAKVEASNTAIKHIKRTGPGFTNACNYKTPILLRSHVLQQRRPDWPIGEALKDERERQVLVEALLRTLFDDVRPEDYTPSRAGANSRVDSVLPEVGIIVETKVTRESMSAKKLGEELLVDAGLSLPSQL
ncbi:MAG: transposase [Paenarthrobacter ureafaciens]|uniref:PD-(D/E)XK nuclease domain-containing protein n=1 Tax=Paenarthrobacter ureafaciens TaxID=37931 RepID=UPI001ACF8EF0|nr:hypothetical protein [Paenarthrobacter ureafaciens]MBN9131728.1 transposase [Paenarthrobacter ureafaciens]